MKKEDADQLIRCVRECWWRVLILLTIPLLLAMWASSGWPILFVSKDGVAAWVQAIGAIAAIIYSYRAGKRQTETALLIHTRDVEQQKMALQAEIDRLENIELLKVNERRENSYAEASVYRVALQRLVRKLRSFHTDNKNILLELNELEEEREKKIFDELVSKGISRDLANFYLEDDGGWVWIVRRVSYIRDRHSYCQEGLSEIVKKLLELPRKEIRSGDSKLANYISSAINNLQTAVLEIEGLRDGEKINFSVFLAITDIENFLQEVESYLFGKQITKLGS